MLGENSPPQQLRGRGRPFRPGESGNPAGKPRGTRNRATRLLDRMAETDAADVLQTVIDRAKGGDMAAAGLLMSRIWPPRKGRPVEFEIPPLTTASDLVAALSSLIQAVASGFLTPDEGQAVASVLETQRKAIEIFELEARVARLEEHASD